MSLQNVDRNHQDIWTTIMAESSRRNPDTHRTLRFWILFIFNSAVLVTCATLLLPSAIKSHAEAIECEQRGPQNCWFGLPVAFFSDVYFCVAGLVAFIFFFGASSGIVIFLFGHKYDLIHARLKEYNAAQGVELAKALVSKLDTTPDVVSSEFGTARFQDAIAAYLFHH